MECQTAWAFCNCSVGASMQGRQDNGPWDEAAIFLALFAASAFRDRQGRAPGEAFAMRDPSWELDIRELQNIVAQQWHETGAQGPCIVSEELVTEICRSAGSSMHCMGSIMGGCAAQEAIKVLMCQFVPVSGVLVFDGVRGCSSVVEA